MVRIAVDIGGTFTDAIAFDAESGAVRLAKVSSTPRDPQTAFGESLARIWEQGVRPEEVKNLVHVTTMASNQLLGQMRLELPRCALVTTKGFRDVLEIGRQNRQEVYNLFFERPRQLVPRRWRFEVDERVDSEGRVLKRAEEEELRILAKGLKRERIECVAVCFLNSFANGNNETKAKVVFEREGLNAHASSQVDPELREYERASTTVVNALLAPLFSRYLSEIEESLRDEGVSAPLQVLTSAGGLVEGWQAAQKPIISIESGPAAGVIATAEVAKALGLRKVISFDMGGTTAKAGTVVDGEVGMVPEIEVGGRSNKGRTVKGSGYPVRAPGVDLAEVSAGGGTIIGADPAGGVVVGPTSAGADPGPACYGKGGYSPTLTDANLLLGRLGVSLLGGTFRLDREAAVRALSEVGERAGLDPFDLATSAVSVINTQMAKAIDIVTVERGLDPRGFSLVAFGGAGPMHAAEVAELVGVDSVIVPPVPGLFSALGMLMTGNRYDEVVPKVGLLQDLAGDIEPSFLTMEEAVLERLSPARDNEIRLERSVDFRYYRQGYEINVKASRPFDPGGALAAFRRKHMRVYNFVHEGKQVEIVALRLTATTRRPDLDIGKISSPPGAGSSGRRTCRFGGVPRTVRVCQRSALGKTHGLDGPAIIEEYDSTTVIPPGWKLQSVNSGCLVLGRSRR
ncbi:MAG: hydantoinase/oxoprolinase family protein [Nitrososphaerales archaeon]